ncbi:MAG: cell division protein FtsQ/DivIB [Betaproteobacteria bacterium]|nr:cell division protein FtsQ/DivIB [Betaproteobacteria bacterium]
MLVKSTIATGTVAVVASATSLLHLDRVQVHGDTAAISQPQVTAALAEAGSMTSWGVDLDAFTDAIEQQVAVRRAEARLVLPGTVMLSIQARQPLARTRTGALLDVTGETYHAANVAARLPIYDGPLTKASEAARMCTVLLAQASAAGFAVSQITWRADGWQVLLGNGWRLRLGRSEVDARIGRFASAWPQLSTRFATLSELVFDLRYMRGMAVSGLAENLTRENENG